MAEALQLPVSGNHDVIPDEGIKILPIWCFEGRCIVSELPSTIEGHILALFTVETKSFLFSGVGKGMSPRGKSVPIEGLEIAPVWLSGGKHCRFRSLQALSV